MAFFSQLTIIGASDISELKEDLLSEENIIENPPDALNNIKSRFTLAAYILFVIGLVELILIMRLLS